MANYLAVGKIINTFGIKGELKIDSNFEYKDRILKIGSVIYIGEEKTKESINSHRVHKGYDLIILNNYNNINEVLKYKGAQIYILKEDLNLAPNEFLLSDLIGFAVYDNDEMIGKVIDYEFTPNNVLLKIQGVKTFYLPKIAAYIKNIDLINQKIITNNGKELII